MKADTKQIGGDHYNNLAVQPWAAMGSWFTKEQFSGFLLGNALKYIARAGKKGSALDDIKKANHYLEKWIEVQESAGCTHDCNQGRNCTCCGR